MEMPARAVRVDVVAWCRTACKRRFQSFQVRYDVMILFGGVGREEKRNRYPKRVHTVEIGVSFSGRGGGKLHVFLRPLG